MPANLNPQAPSFRGHLSLLGGLLCGPVIREFHNSGFSTRTAAAMSEVAGDSFDPSQSILDLFAETFSLLKLHHKTDYVFRAAIANKIFLGRHSPGTTVLLPELRVGRSRADLTMINGTSTAYEIKSELDNFDRLDSQLSDYVKMFDLVYVVTTEQLAPRVMTRLPGTVGLISLTPRYTLNTIKDAQSNVATFDIRTIAESLRIGEIKKITRALEGFIPDAPNIQIFDKCLALLQNHNPRDVHSAMLSQLKKRTIYKNDDFERIPHELVPAFIESKVTPKNWTTVARTIASTTVADLMERKEWQLRTTPTCEQNKTTL